MRELAHRERVGRLAGSQFGLVARRQLVVLGVSDGAIYRWVRGGYLYRRLPGVYAVGHSAPSVEANLCAALLWAGPGAMLSHATAVWWWGLTDRRPAWIELCTPRQLRSRAGIRVHGRSGVEREWREGLPVAPVSEVLLQYANLAAPDDLRYSLAQAEYHGWLDLERLNGVRRRRGSSRLRSALARHMPQLAFTRSKFERRMLLLCERYDIPIPDCNVYIDGFLIDAIWRAQKVIVEVDGKDGHTHWSQLKRDHQRDLIHRAGGFVTLRYVWDQFAQQDEMVAHDIIRALGNSRS